MINREISFLKKETPIPQTQSNINENISLRSFFNNDFLSDCVVIDEFSHKEIKSHSILLSSKSILFHDLLQINYSNLLKRELLSNPIKIKIPKIKLLKTQENLTTIFDKCLVSFYQEATINNLLTLGLNGNNALQFLNYFLAMKIFESFQLVENFILTNVINDVSAFSYLVEAINLQNANILEKSFGLIEMNFEEMIKSKDNFSKLMDLPLSIIVKILKSNELNVQREDVVLEIINCYIVERENKSFKETVFEQVQNKVFEQEVNEEKISEKTPFQKEPANDTSEIRKKEDPKPIPEAENEKNDNEIKIKDNQERLIKSELEKDPMKSGSNEILDFIYLEDANYKKISEENCFEKNRLTNEEKLQLVLSCRLSYVDHDFLIKVSKLPHMQEFRDIFIEGISAKLKNYEQSTAEYCINLNPRNSYIEKVNLGLYCQNKNNSNGFHYKVNMNGKEIISSNKKSAQDLYSNHSAVLLEENARQFLPGNNPEMNYEGNNHQRNYENVAEADRFRTSTGFYKGGGSVEENESVVKACIRSPIKQSDNSYAFTSPPIHFTYRHDFDDNGIFYYLGTFGKKKTWCNPSSLNIIAVFFSTLAPNMKKEDLVGRSLSSISTKNEINAFMGVDLGEGRELIPNCYSLKNRGSKKYVLLNWNMEGSVNGNEWYVLDKRVHFTNDPNFNSIMEKEREELKVKGQTSTWGVDVENAKGVIEQLQNKSRREIKGFRFFRIVQILKNSDGEYNLCLSGLEIYGIAFGKNWYF